MNWIKIEVTTPDKPEVIMMAEELGIDHDAVVGKLFRLWIWADLNTVAGDLVKVTSGFIDRIAGHPGFSNAMRSVGWLKGREGALSFPNFDRHNGSSAKARAESNRRVQNHRERNGKRNAYVTPQPLQKPLPDQIRLDQRIKDLSTHDFQATDQAPAAPVQEACVKSCETPEKLETATGSDLERRTIEALGSREEFDLAIRFARENRRAQNPLAWVWSIAKSGKPETGWPWTGAVPKTRVRAAATSSSSGFRNDFPAPPTELCPMPLARYRAEVQAMGYGFLDWDLLESGAHPLPAGVIPDPAPDQVPGTSAAQPLERPVPVPA